MAGGADVDAVNALPQQTVDCLVIGAGPAGLVAATYLARYRRHVCVVDAGDSRASKIPRSRNVPGFPDGVSGPRLLERIRRQSEAAGVVVCKGVVTELDRDGELFAARTGDDMIRARAVLIATGCGDRTPLEGLGREATWRGQVRWCPICDGYETTDQRVVLIAEPVHAAGHALFLRTYTRDLTLVMAPEEGVLAPESVRRLDAAGVQVVSDRPRRVRLKPGQRGQLEMEDGSTRSFDVVYPMTGGEPHVQLAAMLGANRTGDGRLVVDIRQQTSVSGLYAAGDVVASLGQVAVAVAEGAVAATAIHRSLPPNFR